MKFTDTMANVDGVLQISGVSVKALSESYGTPLYIYDKETVVSKAKTFLSAFSSNKLKTKIIYASKASSFIALLKCYQKLGLALDVVSEGELYTAIKAGFDAKNIVFHGNNKLDRELIMALDYGVGTIILDNLDEAYRLNQICRERKKIINVLLRLNPAVEAHTHDYIKTAASDSKFGVAIKNGKALAALKEINHLENLNLVGIHSHIGSQIFSETSFFKASEVMLDFLALLQNEDINLKVLNLGGGFGVYYTKEDSPFIISDFLKSFISYLEKEVEKRSLEVEEIWLEPGRSLINDSGFMLYKVGDIKVLEDDVRYAFIDGGMGDNLRPSLYGAKYEIINATKLNEEGKEAWRIAGKYCESGDVLFKSALIATPERNDLLLVSRAGAYTFSMFSTYNRLRRPAVVFVEKGTSKLVVKREQLEDIVYLDVEE